MRDNTPTMANIYKSPKSGNDPLKLNQKMEQFRNDDVSQ